MAWPKYKKKEDVPKEFADEYHEVEDEWVVKPPKAPEGTPTQEDVDKVKTALEKEREERKADKKEAKEVAAKLKTAEEAAAGKKVGLTEEQIEEFKTSMRADLTEEYKGQLEELGKKIEGMEGVDDENRKLKLDTAVKARMLAKEIGVRGDRVDDLFTLARGEFDLTEDGKPKLTNHPGKTVDVFLGDDLKKRFPEFYVGTKGSGGGAGGEFNTDGSPVVGTTAEDVLKNPKEAIEAHRAATAAATE